MKFTLLTIAIALITGVPATSGAAETPGKKLKRTELFRQLDLDKNSKIEGAEIEALRAAFAKVDATSPVKKIDSNTNGTLEEKEIAAFNEKYSKKATKAAKPAKAAKTP